MHLKNPEILWALFLLIIPLIVHLFRLRRYKKEVFTNVRLLREVKLQTRKSATLKKWLILLTRLLGLTMLVLAFTGPYLGDPDTGKNNTSYLIYLDNSQSLSLPSPQGTLLQRAVNSFLVQWPDDVPVLVITNNGELGPGTKDELRNELLTLKYSADQLDLNEILLKAQPLFSSKMENKTLYLLTDLQRSLLDKNPVINDDINIRIAALTPDDPANTAIDSIAVTDTSPENIALSVFLSQTGNQDQQNIPVSVFSGSDLLARGPAVFVDNKARVEFVLPPGDLENARATIADNGLPYDNTLYFNIPQSEKIKVLRIGSTPSDYLQRIYTDDEFSYMSMSPKAIDYDLLSEQNLVILDQIPVLPPALSTALIEMADLGLSIVQIPALEEDHNSFLTLNQFLRLPQRDSLVTEAAVVNTINYDHPLLKGVFNEQVNNFQYPTVQQYFTIGSNANTVLELAGGLPFLFGSGSHYAFSAPVNNENTDLIQSALVVPVFYSIGLQSMRFPTPYYTMGNNTEVDIRTPLKKDQIVSLDNGLESFIPRQQAYGNYVRILPDDQIETAGHYQVQKAGEKVGTISMNFSRKESRLEYLDPEALENIQAFDNINEGLEQVKSENKVNELWKWFVIFAIAFFLTEMLILKYFK